ncbi:hypothetical protein NL676_006463 [Syzygium grande]|nr:hypothetical protein NL676_006463 [Syzygium grande]
MKKLSRHVIGETVHPLSEEFQGTKSAGVSLRDQISSGPPTVASRSPSATPARCLRPTSEDVLEGSAYVRLIMFSLW